MHHWTYYWLPAILWLGMVAMFSSGSFGAANTGSLLSTWLRTLHIALNARQFYLLHEGIRKSAHFCAYGLLSGLFFSAFRGAAAGWRWTWATLALFVALVTASADEIHQHFTPGRTGAVSDVVLDMTGAAFAQLMIIALGAGSRRRQ